MLCSETYATEQYYYLVCKRSSTKCMYLALKCLNYKETHTTDSKQCEVYQVLKNKLAVGEATELITLNK